MEITIDKSIKALQITKETRMVLNKAVDTAEHGITHFTYPCPRAKLFNIWDLKKSVEKTSNGTYCITTTHQAGNIQNQSNMSNKLSTTDSAKSYHGMQTSVLQHGRCG